MTNPTPPNQDYMRPLPLSLTVTVQVRDSQMDLCGPGRIMFTYDPADPYALELVVFDAFGHRQGEKWTVGREPFCVAALWGIELPSLDLSVTPLTITRATPGQPVRDVPSLRITMREVGTHENDYHYTGRNVYLDIVRADVVAWFTKLTQVVPMGHEHKYMDIDAAIAALLDPTNKEER